MNDRVALLHETSLRLLEEIGVRMEHEGIIEGNR